MDTAVDTTVAEGRQGRHHPDEPGRHGDGHVQFVSLKEATLAVQKSDKTIRRLIKAGKVLYRQGEPNAPYLVDLQSLRDVFAAESLDTVHGQPGHVSTQCLPNEPGQAMSTVVQPTPQDDPFSPVRLLSNEIELLRKELSETRIHARAELETKEQRVQHLMDQLIAAKEDAGKWQQAEAYRAQLYRDFTVLQERYQEVRVRLELLEHNPTPTTVRQRVEPSIDADLTELVAEPAQPPTLAEVSTGSRWVKAAILFLAGSGLLTGAIWLAHLNHLV